MLIFCTRAEKSLVFIYTIIIVQLLLFVWLFGIKRSLYRLCLFVCRNHIFWRYDCFDCSFLFLFLSLQKKNYSSFLCADTLQ